MNRLRFASRSLTFYWRTNIAVVLGVAAAVTVLAGALLVGDSVRGSLRDLVVQRIGRTDLAMTSPDFVRTALVDALGADPDFQSSFDAVAPMVALPGLASEQVSGRRASGVHVYGVDERFWTFHGRDIGTVGGTVGDGSRDVLLSEALATEIGAEIGSTVLLRVQRPTDIPLESLHGRKDELGRTVRLSVRTVLSTAELGEFSLQPQQGDVLAAFVPLGRLQQDLDIGDRINTLLVAERSNRAPDADDQPGLAAAQLADLVRRHATLEDLGLTIRVLDERHALSVESPGTLLDDTRLDATFAAGRDLDLQPLPILTYLVNGIRVGERSIPYSLVTAVDLTTIAPDLRVAETALPPIVLNAWAARDLQTSVNDLLTLEYFVWEDPGRLVTRTADFLVAGVIPIEGAAADQTLAPEYPGISDSVTLSDWDPPFPIDLGLVRPVDEDYWQQHSTTPKAFIPQQSGEILWRSRYGSFTSVRFEPEAGASLSDTRDRLSARLLNSLDPMSLGLAVRDIRSSSLAASRGATDFGEYFAYFSFFLVVSALVLAALFFKLGVEQRVREVGLLRATGLSHGLVTRLFSIEAFVLSLIGSLIGIGGAIGYGSLMMAGLRTFWVDAVGTTALTLHISPLSLLAGAVGGVSAALICIWMTLRSLGQVTERSLLAGQLTADAPGNQTHSRARQTGSRPRSLAIGFGTLGVLLMIAGSLDWLGQAGAFFGAGASFLAGALFGLAVWLGRPHREPLAGHGWWAVSRLGVRNASYRPARSVLSIAVMASATFILISVDTFRRDGLVDVTDPRSGTGGYALLVDTVLPFALDPNSDEGRELLGVSSFADTVVTPFRVLPGDDASCLNLYEPLQPRIMGVTQTFVSEGRFTFGSSLEGSDEERANPWLLLEREDLDGAIPVVADANSMTYVLHRSLGEEIVFSHRGRDVRLKIVAALSDSLFQSELLMSEANFTQLFPEQEGYAFLLVKTPDVELSSVSSAIEDRLADFGADARSTADRIAEFHRVENTYLSTFQTLGGLGLLLGTVGLAAVLLRNVLERRQELALLGAVGYGRSHLLVLVVAESALLLISGLAVGVLCALVAIAPAAADRGGALPTGAGAWLLLFAVLGVGLISSVVAARAATQTPLLDALRAE